MCQCHQTTRRRRHGKRPVVPCGSRGKRSAKANAKEEPTQHPMSSLPHPSSDYALPPGLDTTEVPMDAHLDNKWRPVEEFVSLFLALCCPSLRTSRLLIFSSYPCPSFSYIISSYFLYYPTSEHLRPRPILPSPNPRPPRILPIERFPLPPRRKGRTEETFIITTQNVYDFAVFESSVEENSFLFLGFCVSSLD